MCLAADRIAATLQLLTFFFISVFAFDPQELYSPTAPSFFQLPVLMLMLITLLNDGTLISIGYDHVIPSHRPEKWNLKGKLAGASWRGQAGGGKGGGAV